MICIKKEKKKKKKWVVIANGIRAVSSRVVRKGGSLGLCKSLSVTKEP